VERIDPRPDLPGSVIPNLCRGRAVLPLIFVMQLVATVLTLADFSQAEHAINRYVLISLYLQWVGLSCAAALCVMRNLLSQLPPRTLFFACWALLLAITLAVSVIAWTVRTAPVCRSSPVRSRSSSTATLHQRDHRAIAAALLLASEPVAHADAR